MNDHEEFPVVDIIISFGLIKGAGYTPHRSELPPVVLLGEDGPRCELRSVYF